MNTRTSKEILTKIHNPSSSNPNVEYLTLIYTDGTMSCNCPGWTRRVAEDGSRSCKHTIEALVMYGVRSRVRQEVAKKLNPQPKPEPAAQARVARRFRLDD